MLAWPCDHQIRHRGAGLSGERVSCVPQIVEMGTGQVGTATAAISPRTLACAPPELGNKAAGTNRAVSATTARAGLNRSGECGISENGDQARRWKANGKVVHPSVSGVIASLLQSYGYLAVALFVGFESVGVPIPGETMLISAAL